jgi:DNA-binding transcriptional ArsR family regulator
MAEPVPADVLQAISHPLRLSLLVTLGRREQSADELAAAVGASPEAVAEHVAVLTRAQLVTDGAEPGQLSAAAGWSEIVAMLEQLQGVPPESSA